MRCEGQYRALRCVRTRLVERSEGRRLFDKLRAGDVLVVRLVDRLGRNYDDVCETIRDFMRRGVVIKTVMNGMTFDTQDPVQKAVRDALIAFMAATAQAQAEATKAAQRAGIEHAKAKGDGYRGRKPSYTRKQLGIVQIMLGQRANIIQIAKAAGLSRQTVYRIKDDSAGAEAALAAWARVFGVTFQNWMLVSVAIVLVAVLIAWWRQQ